MKTFYCSNCGFVVFFENVRCENCGSALGFVPGTLSMLAFSVEPDGRWRAFGSDTPDAWQPCRNYAVESVCNWMVDAPAAASAGGATGAAPLCRCCRHTDIIPALNTPGNKERWYRLETAKRRLFYTLFELGLPVPDRKEDPEHGLSFKFLEETPAQGKVTTGHSDGEIVLDIAEADDAHREARRTALGEPYRTLLGHFRHEVGHFYWQQLVPGTRWLQSCRRLFGDERQDYAEAMSRYYAEGPAPDWRERFISAYASMHPCEDWAETFAHYLHIVDALATAQHWGFALHSDQEEGGPADVPELGGDRMPFRNVLFEQWLPLSQFLNSMSRSLGQGDAYPFVAPTAVLDKLCLVHEIVRHAPRSRVRKDGGPS